MKHFRNISLLQVAALAICGCIMIACGKDQPVKPDTESLTIKTPEIGYTEQQVFVEVAASGKWTLVSDSDWAKLSVVTGIGNKANIVLSCEENKADSPRTCTLTLKTMKDEYTAKLTQEKFGGSGELKSDPMAHWMELPEMLEGDSYYYITHPMVIGTMRTRNYSFCWDVKHLVANWVAYPLNDGLRGSSTGRSDAWGLDPKVPRKYQPVIYNPYSGGWARGHQLPSADRYKGKTYDFTANEATFFGTNMTPQDYNLNGGVWVKLENYVRDCSSQFDTLYVVTGCLVDKYRGNAYDNDGKSITVPSGYFKALLGYKKNKSIGSQTDGYIGIGYLFENRSYAGSYLDEQYSLSELEAKTGMKFFVNLPSAIGSTKAAKVKDTKDSWWNQ